MAGGASLLDLDKQAVLVTIYIDSNYALDVAGGFSLDPIFLTRPAPESNATRGYRTRNRFLIHISYHQNGAAAGILNDGGDETFIIELQILWDLHAYSLLFIWPW